MRSQYTTHSAAENFLDKSSALSSACICNSSGSMSRGRMIIYCCGLLIWLKYSSILYSLRGQCNERTLYTMVSILVISTSELDLDFKLSPIEILSSSVLAFLKMSLRDIPIIKADSRRTHTKILAGPSKFMR